MCLLTGLARAVAGFDKLLTTVARCGRERRSKIRRIRDPMLCVLEHPRRRTIGRWEPSRRRGHGLGLDDDGSLCSESGLLMILSVLRCLFSGHVYAYLR